MRTLPQEVKEKITNWNEEVDDSIKNVDSFQIDIDFTIGRNGSNYLYFENVIAHMVAQFVLEGWLYVFSQDHDEPFFLKLPIKKECRRTAHWFYECGGIFNQPEQVTYWTKRFEKKQLQIVQDKRISKKQGEFKNYRMPILYDNQRKYKIMGKGVFSLLERIFQENYHIGKKSSIGFGESKLKLKRITDNDVLWKNHKLLRPIPVAYFRDRDIEVTGRKICCPIHPPYYGKSSRDFFCYDVGSVVS